MQLLAHLILILHMLDYQPFIYFLKFMFKKLIFVIKTGYTNFRQGMIVKDKGITLN